MLIVLELDKIPVIKDKLLQMGTIGCSVDIVLEEVKYGLASCM